MEINVWTQLFARAVDIVSHLLNSSSNPQNQSNGGELPAVPAKDVVLTSTSKNVTSPVLKVIRNQMIGDGVFGEMRFNEERICFTMERVAVAIPVGTYSGYKRWSPHFGMTVLGIDVPNRTDIECHPANIPSQLNGCIAVGESIDNGALDNSKVAFDRVMKALPQTFTMVVC